MDHLDPDTLWFAVKVLVALGVLWAGVKWTRKQIIEVLEEWADSKGFAVKVNAAREQVTQQKMSQLRSEVSTAVEDHNECEDAHRPALKPYVTREELLDKLALVTTEVSGFKDVVVQRFTTLETNIEQIALDIRAGGVRQAGSPTVPRS